MNFTGRVLTITSCIPHGRITTYGAIANCAGSPGSSRMVGWILHATKNHPALIPAHRVVNRNGQLTGRKHFSGPDTMRQLLENENIKITDNQVTQFSKLFWDPSKELEIE